MSQDVIDGLGAVDRLNIARLENLENSKKVIKTMELGVSKQSTFKISLISQHGDGDVSVEQIRYSNFLIQIRSFKDEVEGRQEILRFGELDVPVIIRSNDKICTHWEDMAFGIQFMSQHFSQLLKLNKFTLKVDPMGTEGTEFSGFLKIAVKSFPKGKPNLEIANIDLLNEPDFRTVLHNIDYDSIRIMGFPNGRLSNNFACEASELFIVNADGFTLENLLNLKCDTVYLQGTQMTSEDMREVLRNWMDGRLETLRDLHVYLKEDVDIERILTELSDRTGYVLTRTEMAVMIRRRDGKTAKISIPNNEKERKIFNMTIRKSYYF
ncbi:hypothetical protein CAEBREN_02689 [Caenorhabditis brenneri]|uniref:Sdz-33 F-box domain-containing protein n=1 Tax=Caenorhabditis brenneri TaxID=135651 RepID=G0P6H2_CAEBE|nr:hypothetical protein CAEBREN_02689 [Caenorhabditis brenneri]